MCYPIRLSLNYFRYPQASIDTLKRIELECPENKCIGIQGANGSGKSTLLKLISGQVPSDIGINNAKGESIDPVTFKNRIAYIDDSHLLYDNLSGMDNLKLIEYLWQVEDKNVYRNSVLQLLDLFHMSNHVSKKVREYSLGMKHKLFICSMLARDPDLLLLDEPLSSLDNASQEVMIDLLKQFKTQPNKAIILVSHIASFQDKLVDEMYVLENGGLTRDEKTYFKEMATSRLVV